MVFEKTNKQTNKPKKKTIKTQVRARDYTALISNTYLKLSIHYVYILYILWWYFNSYVHPQCVQEWHGWDFKWSVSWNKTQPKSTLIK